MSADEAVRLGFVWHQAHEDAAETHRLFAELGTHPLFATRRCVAFVEDQIDDAKHGR